MPHLTQGNLRLFRSIVDTIAEMFICKLISRRILVFFGLFSTLCMNLIIIFFSFFFCYSICRRNLEKGYRQPFEGYCNTVWGFENISASSNFQIDTFFLSNFDTMYFVKNKKMWEADNSSFSTL